MCSSDLYKDQAKQRAMEEDQTSDIKALITTGDLLTGKPIRMGIKGLFPFLKNMGSAPAIVAGATRKAAAADRI